MVFLLEVPKGGISAVSLAAGCIPYLWHCEARDRAQHLLWWRSGSEVGGCCPDELVELLFNAKSLCGSFLWTFSNVSGSCKIGLLARLCKECTQMDVWWTNQAACIENPPSNSCTKLYKIILFVGRFPIDYVQWIQFGGRDLLLILAAPGSGYVTVGGRCDGHVQPGWLLELLGFLDAASWAGNQAGLIAKGCFNCGAPYCKSRGCCRCCSFWSQPCP